MAARQKASTPFAAAAAAAETASADRCVTFAAALSEFNMLHVACAVVGASNLMMKKLEELIEYDAQIKRETTLQRSMRLMVML